MKHKHINNIYSYDIFLVLTDYRNYNLEHRQLQSIIQQQSFLFNIQN